MKAVEYLVVGKHAGLGLMVYEALVQGGFDGREADAVATVVEYGAQTGELGAVVGKYVQCISVGHESGERLGNHVEVLVIHSLRRAVQVELSIDRSGGIFASAAASGFEFEEAECVEKRGELVGVDKLLHGRGIALACKRGALREFLGAYGTYSLEGVAAVAHGYQSIGIDIAQQRSAVVA